MMSNANTDLSRRMVLKSAAASAGALVLGFSLPGAGRAALNRSSVTLGAWLSVEADGRVRIAQPQSEMGQGIWTSMAQLIAEELEVDWEQVEIYSPTASAAFKHPIYGFQTTAESFSIRAFWEPARQVGAKAREMLKAAAGEAWGADPATLTARKGKVVNPANGQTLAYSELVERAAQLDEPAQVLLKDPSEWRVIGKSIKRADTRLKIDGSAVYGIDVRIDGMLTAVPLFAPSFTGKVKAVDDSAALAVKGVTDVVALDDVVYVVAEGYWPARKGVEALRVDWDTGDGGAYSTAQAFETFRRAVADGKGVSVESSGDSAAAFETAAKTVDLSLEVPYLAHATMEPMNATAHFTPDLLTVWAPTQAQGLMGFVAQAAGLPPEKVVCHTTFLGCGLGRRFELDLPIHAALVSKAVSRPVRVLWGREEDMRRDFYRPGSVARLQGALDADGNVSGFRVHVAGSSILARSVPNLAKGDVDHTNVEGLADGASPAGLPYARQYDMGGNVDAVFSMCNTPIPVGFWRSVGHSANGWMMETFVNRLAAAGGTDPVDLRLRLMKSDRNRAVLKTLVEKSGWGTARPGWYQGVAVHESFSSIVGHVIEISKDADSRFRIERITTVADIGVVVNPDNVRAQMESAIVTGLSAAIFGEITVEDGVVAQENFPDYRMLELAQMPPVEVTIIANGDPIGGVGEAAMPATAPALTHALERAMGIEIHSLPISKHGLTLA
ncbi:xanthine dehydrogenase family protein molybdopterin-binding subunit [Pelagibius marinus]|uniref:xanthine dehydrogenase family protein molybdopterin-binding subunit n=1 Tax=Pelagibius marinus TaxID=2762760 RepID=UPI00187248E4|nr:molybdopterin cofactor-binding domain-containing protein [Pelagibius marinus]